MTASGCDGPWILESTRDVAQRQFFQAVLPKQNLLTEGVEEILASHTPLASELTEKVMTAFVNPAFQSNPHPFVNAETGGPLGYLDLLEG